MCELFCLSSRLPTRATFSLDSFASHGASPGGMIDGWGIAFYDGLDVRLHKEPEPAGDSVRTAACSSSGNYVALLHTPVSRTIDESTILDDDHFAFGKGPPPLAR